jgi:hypothetical protein
MNDIFTTAFIEELEKIAKAHKKGKSRADRVLDAAPGVGAIIGAGSGAVNPNLFDPGWISKGMSGHTAKGRALSAVMGAATGAGVGWVPSTLRDLKRNVMHKHAELMEDENGDPAVKVIGASIEKIDDMKAHGIPLVEPPPGFVYNPELRAFVPNENDPSWLTEPEAAMAAYTQAAYQKGNEDANTQGAQQEYENSANAQMQEQQMAMQQEQQMAAQQGGASQQAAPQQQVPTPPSPASVVGDHPMGQPGATKVKAPTKNSTNSVAR